MPPDEGKIAIYRAKWDREYHKRWGLQNQFAEGLEPTLVAEIERTCRRIYHLLAIDCYARMATVSPLQLSSCHFVYEGAFIAT